HDRAGRRAAGGGARRRPAGAGAEGGHGHSQRLRERRGGLAQGTRDLGALGPDADLDDRARGLAAEPAVRPRADDLVGRLSCRLGGAVRLPCAQPVHAVAGRRRPRRRAGAARLRRRARAGRHPRGARVARAGAGAGRRDAGAHGHRGAAGAQHRAARRLPLPAHYLRGGAGLPAAGRAQAARPAGTAQRLARRLRPPASSPVLLLVRAFARLGPGPRERARRARGGGDMRISVITCTLDAADWLADNILSVATQNYVDFEQVFVDGGSTDGTLELIAKAPHRTVLVESVRGLSAAMNAGVEAASGDIVMHLHGDDYLAGKDALARVAAAFERFGCGWLYGQCRSDFGEGRFLERRAPRWSARRLRTRGNFVAHPAVAIRRELFLETGGFDTSLRCCMDYDLWLRLSRISRPRVIDDFIATFRYHDAAITSRFTDVCLRED